MHDELTRKDIEKMEEELRYRRCELMPELLEEVKRTRAFGDLSENFEYKEAKRAKNKNGSRIRYLENMIKTAKIISEDSKEDEVGLYDRVGVRMVESGKTLTIQLVTTLRTDPLHGVVSKESPFGKAVLGLHVGDRAVVQASPTVRYTVEILSIEKQGDDGSIPIREY
ncbi:MAG: GreA/GreB family elongation factor [Oscillospiraceae bacterium]